MAIINKLEIQNMNGSFALRPDHKGAGAAALAAATAESVTVPTDTSTGLKAQYVIFSASDDFWAYANLTGDTPVVAAVGTDATTDMSILNPTVWILGGKVNTISLFSPNAQVVSMQFFM